jgi:hypothetical protein
MKILRHFVWSSVPVPAARNALAFARRSGSLRKASCWWRPDVRKEDMTTTREGGREGRKEGGKEPRKEGPEYGKEERAYHDLLRFGQLFGVEAAFLEVHLRAPELLFERQVHAFVFFIGAVHEGGKLVDL